MRARGERRSEAGLLVAYVKREVGRTGAGWGSDGDAIVARVSLTGQLRERSCLMS